LENGLEVFVPVCLALGTLTYYKLAVIGCLQWGLADRAKDGEVFYFDYGFHFLLSAKQA